jgi:SAM-dependent methyltransferase
MDPLERWRLRVVLPFVRGRLLDLACGYNNLVRAHGCGAGADVFPWQGIDVRIGDPARLPFRDDSFDTVSVVAALNHIPDREAALLDVKRVLRSGGLFLATMIGPWTGRVAHLLFRQDEDRRGGMRPGEVDGIPSLEMRALLQHAGFEPVREVPFQRLEPPLRRQEALTPETRSKGSCEVVASGLAGVSVPESSLSSFELSCICCSSSSHSIPTRPSLA